jgi:ERCC4-related helicase
LSDTETLVARPYQQNIIDVCIKQNSIVFLPTGAGKSYIAFQVIKHFSDQIIPKYSNGGKRSFFLVNTTALAYQQYEALKSQLPFEVCVLTGDHNVDFFEHGKWQRIFEENQIFVMTCDVFKIIIITHSHLKLNQVNVLIFDECHHATKNHTMHQIMQRFKDLRPEEIKKIRVIGLSGMLVGNDNSIKPQTVASEIRQLEATLQSTVISVNHMTDQKTVLRYATNPRENFVRYTASNEADIVIEVKQAIEQLTKSYLNNISLDMQKTVNPRSLRETKPKKISDLLKMFNDAAFQGTELGSYGYYLALLSVQIQLELTKKSADSVKFQSVLKICITIVDSAIKRLNETLKFDHDDPSDIFKNLSVKTQKLLHTLGLFFTRPNREKDLQCLIFVERRLTAKVLYHIIKAYAKNNEKFPIIPDFMVGQNCELPESIEALLSDSFNKQVIEKFSKQETNCIVCTNVLEEGIDLQMCNLVIRFDSIKTYRSYVQSRGRARDGNSDYVALVKDEEIPKLQKNKATWDAVDSTIKEILIGNTIDRLPPTPQQIMEEQIECWEPYYTKTGNAITALNCIP